jgi:hypothetical protein
VLAALWPASCSTISANNMATSRALTDTNQVSRALIAKMLAEGTSSAPIQHWTQGLARLSNALVGGMNLSALRGQEKEAEAAKLAQAEADREATSRATSGAIDALFPQSSAVQPPTGSPVAAALGSPQAAVNDRFGSWDTVNVPPQAQPGIVAALGGQPASGGMFGGMPGFAPGERPIGWPEPPAPQTGSMPSAQAQAPQAIPQAAPQQQPTEPMQSQLPPGIDRARLLQVLADPKAPKELKELALSYLKPNKPLVTIDQRGESEFSKVGAREQAQRFNKLAEEGPKAQQMMSDLETLRTLGSQIGTGKEAQIKAALGPIAELAGIKIDGLGEIQAYEAVVNRVAPNLRVPGVGAQSDFELKNFLKSLPALGNTPEGNELITRTMEGLYQNKMRAAEIASLALSGKIPREDAERALRELPDHMKEWREFMKKNPPKKTQGAAPLAPGNYNWTPGGLVPQ